MKNIKINKLFIVTNDNFASYDKIIVLIVIYILYNCRQAYIERFLFAILKIKGAILWEKDIRW